MSTSVLKASKKALRKAMSSKLSAIPAANIRLQSQSMVHKVVSLPFFQQCRSVSCYLSMPSGEVQTWELVSEILKAGKQLFVPKIDQSTSGRMDFLQIYDQKDLGALPSGVWGIREPDYVFQGKRRLSIFDPQCDDLDVILLPGVAFDRALSRLGHGRGFYDRFITAYTNTGRKRPLLVGLALEEQLVDSEVPVGETDWKMDMIIVPDEIVGAQME